MNNEPSVLCSVTESIIKIWHVLELSCPADFTAETQDVFYAFNTLKSNPLHRITMENSHLFSSILGHLTFIIDITLVAKHHLLNISWGMLHQKEKLHLQTNSFKAKYIKLECGWIPLRCFLSNSWYYQRISHLWCHTQAWCPIKK